MVVLHNITVSHCHELCITILYYVTLITDKVCLSYSESTEQEVTH